MNVVIERNAHAQLRGNASELVYLGIAARLAEVFARPGFLDGATSIGRDILTAVDMIPGVESVCCERYRLSLEIAKAFDADAVVREVVTEISRVIGDSVEEKKQP